MPQQRPGHAQQLPLPQTEVLPPLLHLGQEPLWLEKRREEEKGRKKIDKCEVMRFEGGKVLEKTNMYAYSLPPSFPPFLTSGNRRICAAKCARSKAVQTSLSEY